MQHSSLGVKARSVRPEMAREALNRIRNVARGYGQIVAVSTWSFLVARMRTVARERLDPLQGL